MLSHTQRSPVLRQQRFHKGGDAFTVFLKINRSLPRHIKIKGITDRKNVCKGFLGGNPVPCSLLQKCEGRGSGVEDVQEGKGLSWSATSTKTSHFIL